MEYYVGVVDEKCEGLVDLEVKMLDLIQGGRSRESEVFEPWGTCEKIHILGRTNWKERLARRRRSNLGRLGWTLGEVEIWVWVW